MARSRAIASPRTSCWSRSATTSTTTTRIRSPPAPRACGSCAGSPTTTPRRPCSSSATTTPRASWSSRRSPTPSSRARALARAIDEAGARGDLEVAAAARAAFHGAFPALPPPGVVGRDYASFTTAQRALVQQLLLDGRFHLALEGRLLDGRPCLLSHAGVTTRELALLGLRDERDPRALADRLDRELAEAVGRVHAAWRRGAPAALSLAPLHVTGGDGLEGGGLLYHRPSNPASGSTFDPARPRRFDPRTLPAGLVQIAGHSGHAKCVHELGAWCTERARARKHGGIRTLRVEGEVPVYDAGVTDLADGLILIDGELRRVPASEVEMLPLSALG